MLNTLESYAECGTKAAKAVNVSDGATWESWRTHFQRMVAFERGADKEAATAAYHDAYRAARIVAKVR